MPVTSSVQELQVNLVSRSDPSASSVVNAQKVHKQYNPSDLVELAKSIQLSKEFVNQNAASKLFVIADQMNALEQKARSILEKAKLDAELHNIPCNLQKLPGKIYHLWEKPSGERFFSLIGPAEWPTCKNKHIGSYRLEYDRSWTAENDFEAAREKEHRFEKFSRAIEF